MRASFYFNFITLFVLGSNSALFADATTTSSQLDLTRMFWGSPFIYATLAVMSLFSLSLWLYYLMIWRHASFAPYEFIDSIKKHIEAKEYHSALQKCHDEPCFAANILACAIAARKFGHQAMMEVMQTEGKRLGSSLWQRVNLLNDIATTAPMLGLLGTVLGMFYAFYDNSHSQESMLAIFDGLGIAIGTTVAGLIVAILAMVFHTILKLRVTSLLNNLESEVLDVGALIE